MLPAPDVFQKAVIRLKYIKEHLPEDGSVQAEIDNRDEVLARYQPIFTPQAVGAISQEDFRSFLLYRNNKHWYGLQRQGATITRDMNKLREALTVLLDESKPIQQRLDTILPKSGAKIRNLGRAVVTAILLVAFPDRYGVMNNVSIAGAEELGLLPQFERGASFGQRYAAFNEMLLEVSRQVGVDLWALDALWYQLCGKGDGEEAPGDESDAEPEAEVTPQARFGLERYLQEFMRDNWDSITELRDWSLFEEDGEVIGFEYNTREIGKIDLLACHKNQDQWLVIELKRNQTSDETIGQTLRYMGWVSKHLARSGESVQGMIICHKGDSRIQYALDYTRNVDLLFYEVEFRLRKGKDHDHAGGARP